MAGGCIFKQRPRIVAQYFLNYARQLGVTARIVRGDRGSEIGNLVAFQRPMWPLGCVRFAKYSVFSNVHRKVFIVVQIKCRNLFLYVGYRAEKPKELKILININFISSSFSM